MDTLIIALLAILLGNQIYIERKLAKFGNELKHINKRLEEKE